MTRVVLDTNVVVSALLPDKQGKRNMIWLSHEIWNKKVVPVVSLETTEEVVGVLNRLKFKFAEQDQHALLDDYIPFCEIVSVPPGLDLPKCRDPNDQKFLSLAKAANANALVTGDKDLLTLVDHFSVPIITPAIFCDRLAQDNNSKVG